MSQQPRAMRYYVVRFKFEGKAECLAGSADFFIEDASTHQEVQQRAQSVANEKLQAFFAETLPDAALPFLKDPEHVIAVPGCLVFVEGEA